MNGKGIESGILTIIYLIIGVLVLIFIALFLYTGFNQPAKGAVDKGKEFLTNLDEVSLVQLKSEVQNNPAGVLSGLLNKCKSKDIVACNQYISICEKGENHESSVNKLNQNEIDKLREYCATAGIVMAKEALTNDAEVQAEILYLDAEEKTNEYAKTVILLEIKDKYADTNIGKVLLLGDLPAEEFAKHEKSLFGELVLEEDYENLIRLARLYAARTNYKPNAINAYSVVIDESDPLDLAARALMERAAISGDPRGNYASVYEKLEKNEALKQYFKENGDYEFLMGKLKDMGAKSVSFEVVDSDPKFEEHGILLPGQINTFREQIVIEDVVVNPVYLPGNKESTEYIMETDSYKNVNFVLKLNGETEISCTFKFDKNVDDLTGSLLVFSDGNEACSEYKITITSLGDFFRIITLDDERFKVPQGFIDLEVGWNVNSQAT